MNPEFTYQDKVRVTFRDPRWQGQIGIVSHVPDDPEDLYSVEGLTDAVTKKPAVMPICFHARNLELVEDAGNAFKYLSRSLEPGQEALECEDGHFWVFLGWRRKTSSHEAVFARTYDKDEVYGKWRPLNDPWIYHAVTLKTLCRKFPSLHFKIPR